MITESQSIGTPYSPAQAALAKAAAAKNGDPLEAAKEFESVFLNNFLSSMFTNVSTDGPFGGGQAEETWRGFLIQEYADGIVKSGGIGITEAVHRELISLQEEANQ